MKALLPLLLLAGASAAAQPRFQDSMAYSRASLNRSHMIVLASWAGANLVGSGIAAGHTSGSDRSFHQMNVYWNLANAAIATLGLLSIQKQRKGPHNYERNLKEQHKIETVIAVNGGLDLAYMATGLYLKERGNRLNKTQLTGYGNSLLLQGGFLLAFDIFQYLDHRRNGKRLEKAAAGWQLGAGADGVGLSYRF